MNEHGAVILQFFLKVNVAIAKEHLYTTIFSSLKVLTHLERESQYNGIKDSPGPDNHSLDPKIWTIHENFIFL